MRSRTTLGLGRQRIERGAEGQPRRAPAAGVRRAARRRRSRAWRPARSARARGARPRAPRRGTRRTLPVARARALGEDADEVAGLEVRDHLAQRRRSGLPRRIRTAPHWRISKPRARESRQRVAGHEGHVPPRRRPRPAGCRGTTGGWPRSAPRPRAAGAPRRRSGRGTACAGRSRPIGARPGRSASSRSGPRSALHRRARRRRRRRGRAAAGRRLGAAISGARPGAGLEDARDHLLDAQAVGLDAQRVRGLRAAATTARVRVQAVAALEIGLDGLQAALGWPSSWARRRARSGAVAMRKNLCVGRGNTTVVVSRPSATRPPPRASASRARWRCRATTASRTAGWAETVETAAVTSAPRIAGSPGRPSIVMRPSWIEGELERARQLSAGPLRGRVDAALEDGERHGPVHGAGVEVSEPQRLGHASEPRCSCPRRGPVDGDDHPGSGRASMVRAGGRLARFSLVRGSERLGADPPGSIRPPAPTRKRSFGRQRPRPRSSAGRGPRARLARPHDSGAASARTRRSSRKACAWPQMTTWPLGRASARTASGCCVASAARLVRHGARTEARRSRRATASESRARAGAARVQATGRRAQDALEALVAAVERAELVAVISEAGRAAAGLAPAARCSRREHARAALRARSRASSRKSRLPGTTSMRRAAARQRARAPRSPPARPRQARVRRPDPGVEEIAQDHQARRARCRASQSVKRSRCSRASRAAAGARSRCRSATNSVPGSSGTSGSDSVRATGRHGGDASETRAPVPA